MFLLCHSLMVLLRDPATWWCFKSVTWSNYITVWWCCFRSTICSNYITVWWCCFRSTVCSNYIIVWWCCFRSMTWSNYITVWWCCFRSTIWSNYITVWWCCFRSTIWSSCVTVWWSWAILWRASHPPSTSWPVPSVTSAARNSWRSTWSVHSHNFLGHAFDLASNRKHPIICQDIFRNLIFLLYIGLCEVKFRVYPGW